MQSQETLHYDLMNIRNSETGEGKYKQHIQELKVHCLCIIRDCIILLGR